MDNFPANHQSKKRFVDLALSGQISGASVEFGFKWSNQLYVGGVKKARHVLSSWHRVVKLVGRR